MPLYEYECNACGNRFERIQKFSDPPITACPKCEGEVRKLLSAPAIQFKGSGWYITDYAKKGGTGAGEKSDKAEKSDGGSAEKKDSAVSADKPASSPAPASSTSSSKSD
jgi:putative FmdB family regulatory protein